MQKQPFAECPLWTEQQVDSTIELFKNVLDDHAVGAFSGRILAKVRLPRKRLSLWCDGCVVGLGVCVGWGVGVCLGSGLREGAHISGCFSDKSQPLCYP